MVEPSAEEEKYQEPDRSTADYADYQKPQKPPNPIWQKLKKLGGKAGVIAAILVLLAGVGGGGYWLYKNRKSEDKPAQQSPIAQNSEPVSQITSQTVRFDSASFKLGFDYPNNWTASEDNPDQITVLSPDLKLKGTDGKTVNGQVYFRIRSQSQKLEGLDGGAATAILASKKIAYTSPTQAQRASSYISFLRYPANTEGLDAIYITGDTGYEKDQTVPETDIKKVDPIISLEFFLCPDSGCQELSGVYGIGVQTWDDTNVSVPLENMLKSLVIN